MRGNPDIVRAGITPRHPAGRRDIRRHPVRPLRQADRLSGRRLCRPLPRRCRGVRGALQRRGAALHRGAPAIPDDGLQGRVRGRAPSQFRALPRKAGVRLCSGLQDQEPSGRAFITRARDGRGRPKKTETRMMRHLFPLLARLKRLRGTAFDPFAGSMNGVSNAA